MCGEPGHGHHRPVPKPPEETRCQGDPGSRHRCYLLLVRASICYSSKFDNFWGWYVLFSRKVNFKLMFSFLSFMVDRRVKSWLFFFFLFPNVFILFFLQGGVYLFTVVDYFGPSGTSLLVIACAETIVVAWIYGKFLTVLAKLKESLHVFEFHIYNVVNGALTLWVFDQKLMTVCVGFCYICRPLSHVHTERVWRVQKIAEHGLLNVWLAYDIHSGLALPDISPCTHS